MREPWFLYSQQPSPYFVSNSFLGIFLSSKWNWMLFVSGVCHPICVHWCQNSVLLCDRGIFHCVMGQSVWTRGGEHSASDCHAAVYILSEPQDIPWAMAKLHFSTGSGPLVPVSSPEGETPTSRQAGVLGPDGDVLPIRTCYYKALCWVQSGEGSSVIDWGYLLWQPRA